jgi:hypothetical protein
MKNSTQIDENIGVRITSTLAQVIFKQWKNPPRLARILGLESPQHLPQVDFLQ